jgi:hypothetical protein
MKISAAAQTPLGRNLATDASNSAFGMVNAAQGNKLPDVAGLKPDASKNDPALRKAFNAFVGQTFYGQMLKSMEKTVGKPAYMYGGRTEEVFREKLNDALAEKLSDASSEQFTGPMFELFSLQRR